MDPKPLPTSLPAGQYQLRFAAEPDEQAVIEHLHDPEISRWTTIPYPYGPNEFRQFREATASLWGSRTGLHFVIVDDQNSIVGGCGTRLDWASATASIGYWVAADQRDKKVGTTAAKAFLDWLVEQGFLRIEADVLNGNEASGRLLAGLGFQLEGISRSVHAGRCGLESDQRIDIQRWAMVVKAI